MTKGMVGMRVETLDKGDDSHPTWDGAELHEILWHFSELHTI